MSALPRVVFTLLVLAVAVQRLLELRRSSRNEAWIRARGGREHAPAQMPWMRALHGAWLVAMVVEVWTVERPPVAAISVLAALALAVGQLLRVAAIDALGPRWTVKIMTVPGERAVTSGVFRWIRHPNYLGVILEIAALPLLGGAYATALIASLLNGALLFARVRAEERALTEDSGYHLALGARPRFLPTRAAEANDA